MMTKETQDMLYNFNKQKLAPFMSKMENLIILEYFIQKLN